MEDKRKDAREIDGKERAMIERKDVMPINFLKKENFCGSYRGMRYRMEKGAQEDPLLVVTVWPEPYGYDATPEEEKRRETFPFTEEGIRAGVDWLNIQHERDFSR